MDIVFTDKIKLLFKEQQNSLDENFEKNPIDYIMSYKNILSEKVLKAMLEHILDMNRIVIELIDQGKEEGVVNKNIPSHLIACSIVGTIGEYFNLKIHKKNYSSSDEHIIFNLLFNGFGVK